MPIIQKRSLPPTLTKDIIWFHKTAYQCPKCKKVFAHKVPKEIKRAWERGFKVTHRNGQVYIDSEPYKCPKCKVPIVEVQYTHAETEGQQLQLIPFT